MASTVTTYLCGHGKEASSNKRTKICFLHVGGHVPVRRADTSCGQICWRLKSVVLRKQKPCVSVSARVGQRARTSVVCDDCCRLCAQLLSEVVRRDGLVKGDVLSRHMSTDSERRKRRAKSHVGKKVTIFTQQSLSIGWLSNLQLARLTIAFGIRPANSAAKMAQSSHPSITMCGDRIT